jgi:CPA2 family monovalent cation:H+ antiporter-2
MTELQLPLILNLIVFILLPFVGGFIATRLRLPRMIGYIMAGIVLGLLIQGRTGDFLPVVANFGLVFLLFTVGLEVDMSHIKRFGKLLIAMTLLQVIITMVFFFITTSLLGFSFFEALITSFAFSLSSTAVVSKIIQDSGEENSLIGGMVLGVLILQDIIVIPFMIMMSSLNGGETSAGAIIQSILFSCVRAVLVLGLMYVAAQQFVPFIFEKIAQLSRELLNLLTILFIFVAVYIFSFLGLSPAIAAFVSGVLIGGTLEHYQIFSQIRPLRDIFTILFFVFLGATINIPQILPKLPEIIAFSLFVIAVKFVVITIVFLYFRFHSKTAFTSAILMSQVGEFAFIVLHQGQMNGTIADHRYMFILASTLLTIGLSPLLIDRKDRIYVKLRSFTKKHMRPLQQFIAHRIDREPIFIDALEISDHIVLCGYGRVGGYIGRALTMANLSFVAIDYNYHIVEKNRKQGINIIYGDPTNVDILTFAQVPKATTIISAVPDSFSQEMIVLNAKRLNPNIKILTRVGVEKNQKRMKDLGAHVIIQPEFEAAVSIVKKIYIRYNLPEKDIVGKIKRLKLEHGMM